MSNNAVGSVSRNIRKLLISAAAIGVAASVPAPAFAGGGGGRHGGYYYQPRHYSHDYRPHYSHYRYYDHRHHRRSRISGGEAALIAAGIIGGVILIDRAIDNRNRNDDRYYSDRRYDDRSRRGAFDDEYYYRRDDRPYDDRDADWRYDGRDFDDRGDDRRYGSAGPYNEIDDILLGGEAGPDGRTLVAAAFRECVAETRGAAGAGGMTVAMPGAPTEVEQLADGSVRMKAQFRASNPRGESWTRRFVCEADRQGVRFLQVD